MDLTTNGVVITDAIKFVQTNKEKLTGSKEEDGKESKEPDYDEEGSVRRKARRGNRRTKRNNKSGFLITIILIISHEEIKKVNYFGSLVSFRQYDQSDRLASCHVAARHIATRHISAHCGHIVTSHVLSLLQE